MLYKNNALTAKTFYGVTFKPGDVKDVPGYINDVHFVRVSSMPKEPPKRVESVDKPAPRSTRGRPPKASVSEVLEPVPDVKNQDE